MKLTAQQVRRLIVVAAKARQRAHAPYSKFQVGAALLTANGRIFTGVNVENASYGLTMCAERVAIGKAVSEGERHIVAVAVVTPGGVTPCGACRQVLAEFGDCTVFCADAKDGRRVTMYRLEELLPEAFGLRR